MKLNRPIIVMVTAAFAPGFKGGGPIRSLANLAFELKQEFRIRIVTRDRDVGDVVPYATVMANLWSRRSGVAVFYGSGKAAVIGALRSAVIGPAPAVLYLNSFFHPAFSILPLLLVLFRVVMPSAVILAPRGEFSAGALAIHPWRKRCFVWLSTAMQLHARVQWHATTKQEADEIRKVIGRKSKVCVARNITQLCERIGYDSRLALRKSRLSVLFLSRISEKKNLDFAIRALQRVSVAVEFRIAGPVEDERYWRKCQVEIAQLPRNIHTVVLGPVEPSEVQLTLAGSHLFFLPTRGENYGHAIAESLIAGVPVLISDQTPWRDLTAKNAGWDLSLHSIDLFADAIERCARMNDSQYVSLCAGARRYAEEVLDTEVVEESRKMFQWSLRRD